MVGVATDTGRRASVGINTWEPVRVEPCAWRRAPAWKAAPAPQNLDSTARTYVDARTASLDAHPSPQNAIWKKIVSHSNSKGDGTRRDETRDATRRDATRDPADYYWCSRRQASRGTSSHARTQLRLASPRPLARTHARTKRIRFPGWTHPPTSDINVCTHT